MIDGIYSITFRGAADWGMGMVILQKGVVTGADASGILYDGNFTIQNGIILIGLTMNVPPGVALVQGAPAQPKSYTVRTDLSVPITALEQSQPVLLKMPHGPVNVIFRRLRMLSA